MGKEETSRSRPVCNMLVKPYIEKELYKEKEARGR